MEEQANQELATEVGNEILQTLIQEISKPLDPNAWKTDGLIDWVAKRTATWRPIRPSLHDHRKTIDRIPWAQFARAHLESQSPNVDTPKEIFKHLKRFSRIQARTSSWRASNEDFREIGNEDRQCTSTKSSKIVMDAKFKGTSCTLAQESKLITMEPPHVGNEGEQIGDEMQAREEDVVNMDQHAFDGPHDFGGESDEAKQMEEAHVMAEAMRQAQVAFFYKKRIHEKHVENMIGETKC